MTTAPNIYYQKLSNAIINCGSAQEFIKLDKLIKEDKLCINIKNVLGLSAMHECAYANNEFYAKKIMKSLITAGADVNACDSGGASILHHTIKQEKLSLLKVLLSQSNINVNIASPLGSTALMLCIDKSRDYYFAKFSQDMAIKLEKNHIKNRTAIKDTGMIMAELLIKSGADYNNLKNADKKTAYDLTKVSAQLFEAYETQLIEIEKSKVISAIDSVDIFPHSNSLAPSRAKNESGYLNKI